MVLTPNGPFEEASMLLFNKITELLESDKEI